MIELQPAEQTAPRPNWPLPAFLHPCTPVSTKGDLGTVGINGASHQGGFSPFRQGRSCKAHEYRMLFLDLCAYALIQDVSGDFIYRSHIYRKCGNGRSLRLMQHRLQLGFAPASLLLMHDSAAALPCPVSDNCRKLKKQRQINKPPWDQ